VTFEVISLASIFKCYFLVQLAVPVGDRISTDIACRTFLRQLSFLLISWTGEMCAAV